MTADLGTALLQFGLLLGVLIVLRGGALLWVPLDSQPLVCRRKVARRPWLGRPLAAVAVMTCLAGAVLMAAGD